MDLKRIYRGTTAALVLSCTLVGSVVAGPFDTELVSADAGWLAHVNVEALAGSAMMDAMLESGLDGQLAELKSEVGIDLLKD